MSKRYGRNKRRQHREEIHTLQEEVLRLRAAFEGRCRIAASYQTKYEELNTSLERLRELIGPDHIIWPPNTVKAYTAWGDSFSLPSYRTHTSCKRFEPQRGSSIDEQEMNVFLTKVDTDHMRDLVHMKVDYGHNHYGYAVSRRTVEGMPPQALSRRIASQIALLLEQDITRFQQKGGHSPWRR